MSDTTVTLEEAAKLMNVHPQTVVDEHINTGALPAAKIGRGWIMMRSDVMALVMRHINEQTAARMRRITPSANAPTYKPRRRRVGMR